MGTGQLPCFERSLLWYLGLDLERLSKKKNINALQNLITNMLLCTKYKPIDDFNMTGKCIFYNYLD